MPTRDGTSAMIGNTGDGYAKITYVSTGQKGAYNAYGADNNGYWTLSPVTGTTSVAWGIANNGILGTRTVTNVDAFCGVRPVITILKTDI